MKRIAVGQRWIKTDLSARGVYVTDIFPWNSLNIIVYIKDDGRMCARDEESFRKKYSPKNFNQGEYEPESVALALCDQDF